MVDRRLDLDALVHARDLGGLPTVCGRETRWGAVVRSANPAPLSGAGWAAVHRSGIRTVVALRTIGATDEEPPPDRVPPDVRIRRVPVEDLTDAEFVQRWAATGLWATPVYYRDALRRWPDKWSAAVGAVANAPRGGVLVSCGQGRDRTGLLVMLLLDIAGVSADDIADDWSQSVDAGHQPALDELLAQERTCVRDVFRETLATIDVSAIVRCDDAAAVRARLLA